MTTALDQLDPQQVFTVSQLNSEARGLIEDNFQQIWLVGEISNLSKPHSGHMYFSLKDAHAQIRCALFRQSRVRLNFEPDNGQQVLVRARVSLYEARGDFQCIVSQMQLAGDGALQIAFEKLKAKLAMEGLFDEDVKQDLPELPQCIGVVTSPTGAAVRDIIKVLKRRFPSIPVIIYPTQVQGDTAAAHIAEAIHVANARQECDVLIVARGGGSLEDLWSFNEEVVARAIFASDIPIVSGVGHEVDFTIADFVADARAATPSAAAELVSPDINEWKQYLSDLQRALHNSINDQINDYKNTLNHLLKRLRHPGEKIAVYKQRLANLQQRMTIAMQHTIKHKQQRLAQFAQTLNALSPLNTLQRGYAIILKDKQIINDAKQVSKGDKITARLGNGEIKAVVD